MNSSQPPGPGTMAETIRAAERVLRKRAGAATPGHWERPLSTRHKNAVTAVLPQGEPERYPGGIIPATRASGYYGTLAGQRERCAIATAPLDSMGAFARPRSGADLEYIALMGPPVGLALAGLLRHTAALIDASGGIAGTQSSITVYLLARQVLREDEGEEQQ
jgi:hypothetical protein